MTTIATDKSDADDANARSEQQPLVGKKIVLRIRDLRKAFGGQVVLNGISAELGEGEVVLLRGDNGSGKTTLLNMLSGNLEPDVGSIHLEVNGASEDFEFPRRWWQNLNPFDHFTPERVALEGVGRTWQDVRLFSTLTLADNIAVASPRQLGENPFSVLIRRGTIRRQELKNRDTASTRLRGLGLNGREGSSADRISLGQTKRVAIARAIQAGARILFLDEPLAGLDTHGITDVLELLREVVREHLVTLVIVEHVFNIPRILDLAGTVWTLQDGRITVESPTAVREQRIASFDGDIVSWIAKQLTQESKIKKLLPGGAILWKIRNPKSEIRNGEPPLLEVRGLVVRRGRRLVIGREGLHRSVEGLSFDIQRGEIAILQAPNGWGKTTLAEALVGIISAERGEIHLEGKRIEDLPIWERVHRGVAFLPSRNRLFPNMTVKETIMLGQVPDSTGEIYTLIDRATGSLSGGERQRASLSLLKQAKMGIYDEPFSALDANKLTPQLVEQLTGRHGATFILLPDGENASALASG